MNEALLGALAMDLKRAAMSYYRGSNTTAERFLKEALLRKTEIDTTTIKPYLKKLLADLEKLLHEKEKQKVAEDALMYSTRFQNAALVS